MRCTHLFTLSHWLKGLAVSFHLIHGHSHAHLFLSVVFFLSFYLLPKFLFHLFLIPAMVPDDDSMNNPLCHFAIGSMVTFDYVTPDTGYEPKDMELADTNELNIAASGDIYFQTPSKTQSLSPTPTSTTTSSTSCLQSWSIERGNPFWKGAIAIIFLVVSETWKVLRISFL